MFNSVLKHSFRSFRRQKGYFIINLLGLSLGLACSLLISTFVLYELSFDSFNSKKDRIYKLILNGKIGGQEVLVTSTASVIAPTMKRDFPEIEKFLRINTRGQENLRVEDINYDGNRVLEADSSFFQVFSIPLIHGNAKDILNEPYRAVLSESSAKVIFGEENPIDREILIGTDSEPYTVSGIMEDIPDNCHFETDVITSFMTNPRSNEGVWLNNSFETYLLLYPNADPSGLEEKFPQMVADNVGRELKQFMGVTVEEFLSAGNKYNFYLQPLQKIHLDPSIDHSMKPATDPKYLIIFGSVALLIILIASINFTNLSTAQASRRSREVGMKKVAGSQKWPLVTQFLSESILISLLALIVAIVIVKLSLPVFNDLLNSNFSLNLFSNWYTILGLVLAALVVGVIAGAYPAFYLSSISPISIFKGEGSGRSGSGKLRSVLVVFQFAASIILISGTSIMYRQIDYMLDKDLGYNKENLLVLSEAGTLDTRVDAFKNRIKNIPGVVNIAAATAVPNRNNNNNGYMLEGRPDESLLMATSWVDYDHLDTWEMDLVTGRFFDRDYPTDEGACILNEAALKEYNITDPLSARIAQPADEDGNIQHIPVIGVVKDFNHESLQRKIYPYIMRFRTEDFQFGYISVRLSEDKTQETVSQIRDVWKEFTGLDAMPHFFMEDDFNRIYREERQSARLTIIFAVFALFVASIGLFGLTSFMLQQRTREIGIRKAMGASISEVYKLITKDILILVTVAAIIGSPVIYFIARKWLEGYYFRINISPVEFLLGFMIALVIAIVTISFRTLSAAKANPANSLRYE